MKKVNQRCGLQVKKGSAFIVPEKNIFINLFTFFSLRHQQLNSQFNNLSNHGKKWERGKDSA